MQELGDEWTGLLQETLDGLLEVTGARGGWVGFLDTDQRLHFPVRRGVFSEAWLTLQESAHPIWGFEMREGPILLNELPTLPWFNEPVLHNLLFCPLRREDQIVGRAVLVNKASGFTAQDAAVLQTWVHLLGGFLLRRARPAADRLLAAWLKRCAAEAQEGLLMFDDAGTLLFANDVWSDWTGYRPEEFCHRAGPFPFWPGHEDLTALKDHQPILPDPSRPDIPARQQPATSPVHPLPAPRRLAYLPFRNREGKLFWCGVEWSSQAVDGRAITLAYLRRLPEAPSSSGGSLSFALAQDNPAPWSSGPPPAPERLVDRPGVDWLALFFCPARGIDFWDERWEELTGLSRKDIAGVSGETVLDWLFPQQRDRERVADILHQPDRRGAQVVLDVAGPRACRTLCCTFLPLSGREEKHELARLTESVAASSGANAWLLLVGEPPVTAGLAGAPRMPTAAESHRAEAPREAPCTRAPDGTS